jgi:hypothetical protein
MPFNPNIPQPNDLLSNSQQDLLNNNQALNTSFGIDHYTFDDLTINNGRHKDIHLVKRVGNPVATTDTVTIFSKDYTPDTTGAVTDTQLFLETANGIISQLTGKLSGLTSPSDGWNWVGGILLQWGIVSQAFSSGSTTGTVTFKDRVAGAIPFPNNCFIVTGSPLVSFASLPSSQGSVNIRQSTISKTKFDWQFYTNSNQYIGFLWFAVGN